MQKASKKYAVWIKYQRETFGTNLGHCSYMCNDVYILIMSGMQHCMVEVCILVMSGAALHVWCLHTCNVRQTALHSGC